jgi:hypothetical protein
VPVQSRTLRAYGVSHSHPNRGSPLDPTDDMSTLAVAILVTDAADASLSDEPRPSNAHTGIVYREQSRLRQAIFDFEQ